MILLDVHPATVDLPDGSTVELARAALTHARLRVWVVRGREQVLVLDEAAERVVLETRYPVVGRPVPIETAAGLVQVTRARGCGCGSSLKGLRPPTDEDS